MNDLKTKRRFFDYALDLAYGATQYPCGWMKPKTYWGYFSEDEKGISQKNFFEGLRGIGFRRTPWQLIFPEQNAGLIKKIDPTSEGVDEYHIRFYEDGIIDCELEVNRFNGWHWVGPRRHGVDLLENILNNEMASLPLDIREAIRPLFGEKHYSDRCVRKLNSV